MNENFRYGIIISIILILCILIAGCSSDVPVNPVTTVPTTTTPSGAKYVAGDIIAKSAGSTDQQLYVITQYDAPTDKYTRAWIYKNTDGSWGHFIDSRTEKIERSVVEKVYTVKISHVTLSSVPFVTPTVPVVVQTTLSGNAPIVTGISPTKSGRDATVTVSITGSNFLTGATAKLLQPGSPSVTATGLTVTDTNIACTFNLNNKDTGSYNVVVTNPDGQSGTNVRAFTITAPAPIITGINPSKGPIDGGLLSMTINGQNFKDGVYITLTKSGSELICQNPVSTPPTKIFCNLNLDSSKGAQVGDWEINVLNIEDQQAGTWTQKFTITNATAG
jgi:hypothetical protein